MTDLPAATVQRPAAADIARWLTADAATRPVRLHRFRERLDQEGVDAWFGTRREDVRYLTGLVLGEGEEQVAGVSGQTLVSADETVVLADSRYRVQAREEASTSRIEGVYADLPERWPVLLASLRPIRRSADRVRRVAVDAASVSHATWERLRDAAPDVELVAAGDWLTAQREVKELAELERIEAACAVADAALAGLLASIRPGVTERELALDLEWALRTGGAEALAFDVACLSGPRAALPHGSPGDRRVAAGEVLLFDFGAQVCGYRSDMTRTLFVGEATERDLRLYRLVAEAQEAAFATLAAAAEAGPASGSDGVGVPTTRSVDDAARGVISAAGLGERFGHGLGHGIGLATHEAPFLGQRVPERPLPSPTVFSVEPGVYLDGETGVRIEDLVAFDPAAGRCERLTGFPREVTVVGA